MSDSPKLVMIIEDDTSDAKLLEDSLRRAHVISPIVILNSGGAAINYLSGNAPYDNRLEWPMPTVLFLDLKLPDINGMEVLKWISAQPALRRLTVIVHSGYQSTKDLEALYAAGANSFIRKSGDSLEIQNVVNYFPTQFSIQERGS